MVASVVVGGGYSGGSQTTQSKHIIYDNKVNDAIRIAKTEHWLLNTCGGRALHKGGLRRTRAIEQIRGKMQNAAEGDGPEHDEKGSAVADEADPMQRLEDIGEMDPVLEGHHAAKRRRSQKVTQKTPCSERVQSVEMPEHLGKPQLRPVRAMLGAGGKAQCIWLHEGDVPWLITYLADEVATGGVGPIEDSDGEEQDECEEASMTASLDGDAVAAPF